MQIQNVNQIEMLTPDISFVFPKEILVILVVHMRINIAALLVCVGWGAVYFQLLRNFIFIIIILMFLKKMVGVGAYMV